MGVKKSARKRRRAMSSTATGQVLDPRGSAAAGMDWIIEALKILREVRDWADNRSVPAKSRAALLIAADWVQTAIDQGRKASAKPDDGARAGAAARVDDGARAAAVGLTDREGTAGGSGASLPAGGPTSEVSSSGRKLADEVGLGEIAAARASPELDDAAAVAEASGQASTPPSAIEPLLRPVTGASPGLEPAASAEARAPRPPASSPGAGPANGHATSALAIAASPARSPERTNGHAGFSDSRARELASRRERRGRGMPVPSSASIVESPVQEIPLDQIDPHALEVTRQLRRFGYRAYLVGGCVRDLLLGLKPKDFDVATSAKPEEVRSVFRNSRVIGRRFRLVHVYFRGGKIIETSTFRANAAQVEDDGDENPDLLIRRDNIFGTEEEDALRRDFTINGLFYDIGAGRIIDHVGGLADVQKRYLRMIGDPEIRLREDPVRILRAIRFAAKANLTIDPELRAAMSRHKADISRCAPARVLEETLRLLRIGHSETTVRMMEESGVLAFLLPELAEYMDAERPELPEAEEGDAEERGGDLSARELVYLHLRALDQMIAARPVSDAVVLGALLYPFVADEQATAEAEGQDRNRATAEVLAGLGTRLALTRRLSEHLRQIFIAQKHFARGAGVLKRRRRVSPVALARRAFFPDALDLYEAHANALDLPLEELQRWRASTANLPRALPGEDESTAEEGGLPQRPKRRRKRGGRGRSRPN